MGETRSAPVTAVPAAAGTARAVGLTALVVMVACQVLSGISPEPVRYTGIVVAVLAVSVLGFTAAAWGARRAAAGFAAAVLAGYAAEAVGLRTGFPFGHYRYTDLLWPQLGGVPAVVALAWGGMGLAAYAVAAAITTGRARPAVGALALTAWDLFLDPQMVGLGLWTWAEPGPYRGIPLSNYAGWLLVSALVMLLLRRIAGDAPARGAVGVYTTMAVMETVGFAAVFQPPDPLVAAAGGISMGVFAALAWRRLWQKGNGWRPWQR
ncbi:carotenoid biosynthesis protein [Actinomadura sp. ATCC 31491]|uniref:Carotenoid biosynthesis protein n=1 Tax=Actinomadura luzonensis TaxID=2805427 RepID=A0ABT0G731_9ACTN|nr:carotenoid biosynthesis protein [Actinomadura luzonensis]MCK2220319.1 carotenoid biosynthesis protein [Actinomadura luzonensis]